MARETAAPKKGLSLKATLIIVLVTAAALLAVYYTGVRVGEHQTQPTITSDLLDQQLRSVQELVSVDYHYTNMGKFENQVDFYGWSVPFTTKSFILSYDGLIKAGVDLSQVQVTVNDSTHTVTVTLPKSKIISHEIFEDSLVVFNEVDGIFNPITIEDYNGFTQEQKAAVEQKALDNGLLTAADEKAREAVESLLSLLPGMEEYTLTVK